MVKLYSFFIIIVLFFTVGCRQNSKETISVQNEQYMNDQSTVSQQNITEEQRRQIETYRQVQTYFHKKQEARAEETQRVLDKMEEEFIQENGNENMTSQDISIVPINNYQKIESFEKLRNNGMQQWENQKALNDAYQSGRDEYADDAELFFPTIPSTADFILPCAGNSISCQKQNAYDKGKEDVKDELENQIHSGRFDSNELSSGGVFDAPIYRETIQFK